MEAALGGCHWKHPGNVLFVDPPQRTGRGINFPRGVGLGDFTDLEPWTRKDPHIHCIGIQHGIRWNSKVDLDLALSSSFQLRSCRNCGKWTRAGRDWSSRQQKAE